MPTVSEIELRKIRDQVHSGIYNIYPKFSPGVSLLSGDSANPTYSPGIYTQIIPANTLTTSFWIIGAVIFDASSGIEYILDIATGSAGNESDIGTLCFKNGVTGGSTETGAFQSDSFQSDAFQIASSQTSSIISSQDPVFPVAVKIVKNTRISMRLTTSVNGYGCKAKIKYKL